MGVLPTKINERIQWFEQRKGDWNDNAVSIGLSVAQVTQMVTLCTAARTAYDNAQAARINSENATLSLRTAVNALSTYGGDLIKTIKAFAETSGNPEVYTLASVPPPAAPTPAGPPVPPTDLFADPSADGTVTLRWKGSIQHQTFFTVWRKIAGGSFVQIGAVAAKAFIDTGIPQGIPSVSYLVRAQRHNTVSAPSPEVAVNFGIGGNQGVNALRMAA